MSYRSVPPDPETLIASSKELNAQLYAELAPVELYANARLHASGYVGKRSWFRLGWVIKEQRFANGQDRFNIPAPLLAWVEKHMRETYPSHEEATGLSDEEVSELEAEQKRKRAKYQN